MDNCVRENCKDRCDGEARAKKRLMQTGQCQGPI